MLAPDGKTVSHAEIRIGDSIVMLSDEFPDWGVHGPDPAGSSAFGLNLYVDDVDAVFARAVAAGSTVKMPVADQFWGDRYGRAVDPFGHQWAIATHTENLTIEEIQERAKAAFSQSAGGQQ